MLRPTRNEFMEGIILLLLLLVLWIIVMPIIAVVSASDAKRRAADAEREVQALAGLLERTRRELRERDGEAGKVPSPREQEMKVARPVVKPVPEPAPPPVAAASAPIEPEPVVKRIVPEPVVAQAAPPPLPVRAELAREPEIVPPQAQKPSTPPKPPIDLEQFMGVKLFAWLGGVALFFGVIFFVKYAFENNLISPAMRVAMGYLTGTGLLVGGLALHRRGTHQALSQAFCATAVLVLYGVTFAAYERYGFFNQAGTFLLMVLITVTAFLIAVRLNALVVAGLGMAGGFLTPVLVSTGRDELLVLSAYIALLVAGLIAVSRHRNWRFLVTAAVIGTGVIQMGWMGAHFWKDGYADGAKVLWPMLIVLGFQALFMVATWLEKRRGGDGQHPEGAAMVMAGMGWLFGFVLLGCAGVASHVGWTLGFVLAQSAAVMALVWLRPRLLLAQLVSAILCFLHLALWTGSFLTIENLVPALLFYLAAGAAHTVVPLVLARRAETEVRAAVPSEAWSWAAVVPVLLGIIVITKLPEPPMAVWALVLALNLLTMAVAPRVGSMLAAAGGMAATALLMVVWLFSVPATEGSLMPMLGIGLGFTVLFAVGGRWLGGHFATSDEVAGAPEVIGRLLASAMPVMAGLIPFGLLVLAVLRLPVPDPSPVFGVGLVMVVFLLGLAVLDRKSALVPAALGGIFAVQAVWHEVHFTPATAGLEIAWQVGCYLLFLAFPFVFRKPMMGRTLPWITSAVSGIGYFLLVHHGVKFSYPAMAGKMGLLPCAFVVPSLGALLMVVRMTGEMDEAKRSRLAWFGGVALLFITLVFPIQFDRHWLTVSWVMEGALLLWLYRRVPHIGLQLTGIGLLGTVFARLVLNPAVFTEYARSATPIFNTYLYTYGIAAASTLAGAWLLATPDPRLERFRPRVILNVMGGILLFALLNIEIADFFTPEGAAHIAFGGVAKFARDMTYSISWGLFALGLLVLGGRKTPVYGLQVTGLALLIVVFFRLLPIPSVLRWYPQSAMPVFNWYLSAYGIAAAVAFFGAWWLADPHPRLSVYRPRVVLNSIGGVLLFVLLSIEIAEFFTPDGYEFIQFGGGANFARDMTYSIAWGLFALGLLIIGIWRGARPARYAAIALLVGTLLKVFLHDLASLASVFRIGALIGVAVIAFVASFLYQQFFNRSKRP